jgi:hypothetical protein
VAGPGTIAQARSKQQDTEAVDEDKVGDGAEGHRLRL